MTPFSFQQKSFTFLLLSFLGSCQSAASPLRIPVAPGVGLSAGAFLAEAAFLFPKETQALTKTLVRSTLVKNEARENALQADVARVEKELERAQQQLEASLPRGQTLEAWAIQEYGFSWPAVRASMQERFLENQLYQLCVRTWSLGQPQVRLRMWASPDEEEAQSWARRIKAGASLDQMSSESVDAGPRGDGSLPFLPEQLPPPLDALLRDLAQGEGVGPFQWKGEVLWRVAWLEERRPAEKELPRAQIFSSLSRQPISPLEAQSWFLAMLRRYTADLSRPGIRAIRPAFSLPND